MSFLKKMFGLGAGIAITTAASGQEAPKTMDKVGTETTKTISYEAPTKTVEAASYVEGMDSVAAKKQKIMEELKKIEAEKKTLELQFADAQQDLLKEKLNYQAEHGRVAMMYVDNKEKTKALKASADLGDEIDKYVESVMSKYTDKVDDLGDSTNIKMLVNKLPEFTQDEKNPITGDEIHGYNFVASGRLGDLFGANSEDIQKHQLWVGQGNMARSMTEKKVLVEVQKIKLNKKQLEAQQKRAELDSFDQLASN
jgi:hypothetical protein